jgi:hypothetical protein
MPRVCRRALGRPPGAGGGMCCGCCACHSRT